MGSFYLAGSEEQKQKWLPTMRGMEKDRMFGLTDHWWGSGAAGGLTATAKNATGDLDSKRPEKMDRQSPWSMYHHWARDVADNQVKGFSVETDGAGLQCREDRAQDRAQSVQNGLIT